MHLSSNLFRFLIFLVFKVVCISNQKSNPLKSRSIHRFLDKTWQLPDVPQPEAIFNRVTKFDFGHELADDAETETVLDLIKFKDELEAAKMELQRRNNLKRGQFSEMLGDHDNFNGLVNNFC